MEITRLTVGVMQANCYIVSNEKECILIDPGAQPEHILKMTEAAGLTVRGVLLTHGHFDHIGGCKFFQERGAEICISQLDGEMTSTEKNLAAMAGVRVPAFSADRLLRDGDKLDLAGLRVLVFATPGHTEGGLCFKIGDSVFTGDTLFRGGIGRWDFPGGSYMKLLNSIGEKLLTLSPSCAVYPGHGEKSTIGEESKSNPYLNAGGYYDD